MNHQVIYRNGKFFVVERVLSDGSKVYDIWVNGGDGSQLVEVHNAESLVDAMDRADRLAAALA